MPQITERELEESVAAVLNESLAHENVFACSIHPAEPAVAACRRCGKPLCFSCFSESFPELFCLECRAVGRRRALIRGGIGVLKLPVLWVGLCVLFSGIAYWRGFGNPSPAQMIRLDATRAWYMQEAPRLFLGEASRELRRAIDLRHRGREEQALVWARRGVENFARSAELWREAPVYPALRIAEGRGRFFLGDRAGAEKSLTDLELPESSRLFPAFACLRGELCEAAGRPEEAKEFFRRALDSARAAKRKALDDFLDEVLKDTAAGTTFYSVAYACDAMLGYEELLEKLLPRSDLDFPDLEKIRSEQELSRKWERERNTPPPDEGDDELFFVGKGG